MTISEVEVMHHQEVWLLEAQNTEILHYNFQLSCDFSQETYTYLSVLALNSQVLPRSLESAPGTSQKDSICSIKRNWNDARRHINKMDILQGWKLIILPSHIWTARPTKKKPTKPRTKKSFATAVCALKKGKEEEISSCTFGVEKALQIWK